MKKLKKGLKLLGAILAVIVLVVGGYLGYVILSYHRLPDTDETFTPTGEAAATGQPWSIVTWNLGFGAYDSEYGFFMDGGTESRARSKTAVFENLNHAADLLLAQDANLILLQEVDLDATRSYHVDEIELMRTRIPKANAYFGINYDSAYLFYPILRPHGASKSGIMTFSDWAAEGFARVSLPVESGFMKFLDLDRCYTKTRIPTDDGGALCLYNHHLSAYTSDGTIAIEQLKMLTADMLAEYQSGNYVIAGGDFNKDLLGDSDAVFGVSGEAYNWAQPLPADAIPEGLTLVSSLDESHPVPSCRNADGPYIPGQSYVLTVDGFIVSDNVTVTDCRVVDDGFAVSDHNPVRMTFTLNPQG